MKTTGWRIEQGEKGASIRSVSQEAKGVLSLTACLSVLMTRGSGWFAPAKTLLEEALCHSASITIKAFVIGLFII